MSTKQTPVATTTTQIAQNTPWQPAVPALHEAIGGAQALYAGDVGYKPYTGETQAGISSQSQQALDQTMATAQGQGGLLGGQAVNYANGVMQNGGISAGQAGALGTLQNAANGGMQIGTGGYQAVGDASQGDLQSMLGKYGSYLNSAGQSSAADSYLKSMADGSDLGRPNPYMQAALDAANRKTMDSVNGQFSAAGRYGSGAQTDVLSRNIGENNTQAYMQDYENSRNRQLQATGQIDAARQGLLGAQLSGIAGMGNAMQGARSNQLAAAGGIAGIQGQNIGNQLSSASGLSDAYAGGMNRALSTALNGQQFTNQLYDPAQKIAGVGSFYDDRAQNALNAQIAQYDAAQARPWEQVARLNAIATGAGQLGGTSTGSSTQVKPGQSQLQQYLGYGTAGLGLLGSLPGL